MDVTTAYETLRLERSADALRLVLNRPREQNSITGALIADLHRALDLAERTPGCRVVVLGAEGGVFSSGMDLHAAPYRAASPRELDRDGAEFLGLLKRFTTIGRVVVARVDGRVSGGGLGLVAASDLVYATPRSQFSLPEALWGLLPCCVLPFLIRRVGFQKAYMMTLTTHSVTAAQAERFHLVDEVVDDAGPALRRLLYRVTKLDDSILLDLKRYFREMWFLSEEMESTAVREFSRLMSAEVVGQRIRAFTTQQRLPWES